MAYDVLTTSILVEENLALSWKCTMCGYSHYHSRELPETCPDCQARQGYFVVLSDKSRSHMLRGPGAARFRE